MVAIFFPRCRHAATSGDRGGAIEHCRRDTAL
jgi:hypothetical protein